MALQSRQDKALSLLERVASKTSVSADESANLAEIAALAGDELGELTAKAVAKKSLPDLQSCVSRLLEELDVNCLASFTCSPDDSAKGILKAKMTVLGSLVRQRRLARHGQSGRSRLAVGVRTSAVAVLARRQRGGARQAVQGDSQGRHCSGRRRRAESQAGIEEPVLGCADRDLGERIRQRYVRPARGLGGRLTGGG